MNTIFTQLHAGERYAGIIINSATGLPTHHLILLPSEAETHLTWNEAIAWAASIGAELPTRQEQTLLYVNLKPHFKSDWYWSSEQHASNKGYAWCQYFGGGTQDGYHKLSELHARAIRRLPITEEHTQMSRFTEEQLKELETIFGLNREEQTLPVRDGVVTKNTLVWRRGHHGLKHVLATNDWDNIKKNPKLYQLEKPAVAQIIYSD